MIHVITNIGDAELVFATVEFLDSANARLPAPAAARGAIMQPGAIQRS